MSPTSTASPSPSLSPSIASSELARTETVDAGHRLPARTDESASQRPFYKRPFFIWVFIVVIALAIAGTVLWMHGRHYEPTDDAQIDGHVIPMMPEVSARVVAIHFNDNQLVHQGDLLVELDPTDFQAALEQTRGAQAAAAGKMQQANADIESARSTVAQAQAQLAAQQVNLDNAERDLKRYQGLDERAKSQQAEDNALVAEKTASAQVEEAKATLAVSQSHVLSAQAMAAEAAGDLKRAEADTHRAEVQLGYCRIVAPMDGYITIKSIDPGQYVTPSNPMFTLVGTDVWVIANFKETQLDKMKVGQDVKIDVDAYPELDLRGKVQSFQSGTGSRFSVIPAENATGNYVKVVQRVPVKILINRDSLGDRKLSPGMSVEIAVHVLNGEF